MTLSVGVGATDVADKDGWGHSLGAVLNDPEGNEFCVATEGMPAPASS